jgi:hypothetical protein
MCPPDRQTRRRVIGALRQQARQIDAVGGRQRALRAQLRIEKGRLHQTLAVVEGATHGERGDVAAPAGQLSLLGRRHQALRIEDRDPDPRSAVKGGGHRPAGVARGRHQDRQRALGRRQARKAAREKPCAEILEGRRGPVEQLQDRYAAVRSERHERRGKVECLLRDRSKLRRQAVTAHERAHQARCDGR